MYLPLAFKGVGMRCLIIGGGEVALRKLEFLTAAGCEVTVIAPHIHNEIQSTVTARGVKWIAREFAPGDCRGYQLVIAATERREINLTIFEEAATLCIPINVVDDPDLCTVIFPAVWRQGPLTISVNTEGTAPFMAAVVRDRLSSQGASLSRWVETAAKFRIAVRSEISDWKEKNSLYRRFAESIQHGDPPNPPDGTELRNWLAWLETLGKDGSGE
ncbi:MAG: bifunctional precorrin-2 dehydrogenase/sirohydrochlorin ferrochelatase [Acidobacteria bacterium]|nr:bifunctional precorrin-2 dehydrogenase/sirohydrochlorin ferrochelatase [Acidobacteriota bacterium]